MSDETFIEEALRFGGAVIDVHAALLAELLHVPGRAVATHRAVGFIVTTGDETPGTGGSRSSGAFFLRAALVKTHSKRPFADVATELAAVGRVKPALLDRAGFDECLSSLIAALLVAAVFQAEAESTLADDPAEFSARPWVTATPLRNASPYELLGERSAFLFASALLDAAMMHVAAACAAALNAGAWQISPAAIGEALLEPRPRRHATLTQLQTGIHTLPNGVSCLLFTLSAAFSGPIAALCEGDATKRHQRTTGQPVRNREARSHSQISSKGCRHSLEPSTYGGLRPHRAKRTPGDVIAEVFRFSGHLTRSDKTQRRPLRSRCG